MKIELEDYERLLADRKRIDWLADTSNTIGQVLLPAAAVKAHLDDMRAAIDMAMLMDQTEEVECPLS